MDLHIRKVLVIEDEPEILELIGDRLDRMNVPYQGASSPTEALPLAIKERFTLIISDIQMPGMTGVDMLQKLRESGKSTPFVFLTGFDAREYLMQAIRLGAFDFLLKPFSPDELEKTLYRALEVGSKIIEIEDQLQKPEITDAERVGLLKRLREITLLQRLNSEGRGE